jgi:hypothetical protein
MRAVLEREGRVCCVVFYVKVTETYGFSKLLSLDQRVPPAPTSTQTPTLYREKLAVSPNTSSRAVPQPFPKPIANIVVDNVKGAEAFVAYVSKLRRIFGTTISTNQP